mgnify:CR=1 FL=1
MEVTDIDRELKNIRRKFNRNKNNAKLMKKYIGQLENLIARNTANIEARKDEITSLRAKLEEAQAQLEATLPKPTLRHSYAYEQFERSFFKRPHV